MEVMGGGGGVSTSGEMDSIGMAGEIDVWLGGGRERGVERVW